MLEEPLHYPLVLLVQSFVVVANAVLEGLLEPSVGDMLEMGLKVSLLDMKETGGVVVCAAVRDDVICSQATLAARWYEDNDRLVRGILEDCEVCRLRHSDHQRWEVGNLEALDVDVHVKRTRTTVLLV